LSTYHTGQTVTVTAATIQRSNGAAWRGDRGQIVEVTGDGYKIRFGDGFVADRVTDREIQQA